MHTMQSQAIACGTKGCFGHLQLKNSPEMKAHIANVTLAMSHQQRWCVPHQVEPAEQTDWGKPIPAAQKAGIIGTQQGQ